MNEVPSRTTLDREGTAVVDGHHVGPDTVFIYNHVFATFPEAFSVVAAVYR